MATSIDKDVLLQAIINRMNKLDISAPPPKGPQQQVFPTRFGTQEKQSRGNIVEAIEVPEVTIPPFISDDISAFTKRKYKNQEIEVSFGHFGNRDQFFPGLFSAAEFDSLLKRLTDTFGQPRTYRDIITIGDILLPNRTKTTVRRIVDQKTNTDLWQMKRRSKNFVTNSVWGYRISSSTEENIQKPKEDFIIDLTRTRVRYSFSTNAKSSPFYGFRFDISMVKEEKRDSKNYTKYEAEIERVGSDGTSSKRVSDCIELVLLGSQNVDSVSDLFTLKARRFAVYVHNLLFAPEIKAKNIHLDEFRLFKDYWNKPTNIKIQDLLNPNLNEYLVTVKLDGTRGFILFGEIATYICGPPNDIRRIGEPVNALTNTLLDVEIYINTKRETVFYAFDILFDRGRDIRNINFSSKFRVYVDYKTRLDTLREIVNGFDFDFRLMLKTFYPISPTIANPISKTFYENVKSAFDEFDTTDLVLDGLIFQSAGAYINFDTKKWKPRELLTIDFEFKKIDENTYELHVGQKNRTVPFKGSYQHPYSGVLVDRDLWTGVTVYDGAIMECRWVDNNFRPIKARIDRDRPNALETAKDVWADIMNPISRHTIEGDSFQVMRRYHNAAKKVMIDTHFTTGDSIMDWGSGRGGDLKKWTDRRLSKVFVVEPNANNLKELLRRKEEFPKLDIEVVLDGEGLAGAEDSDALKAAVGNTKLAGITSFFSLTFFGANVERWRKMINSIDILLPKGGKFVGIVMDGRLVKDVLDANRTLLDIPEGTPAYIANPSFSITQVSEFSNIDFDEKMSDIPEKYFMGNEIEINISEESSMVKGDNDKGQIEWLFYFEKFEAELKKIGITLVDQGFLDHALRSSKTDPTLTAFKSALEKTEGVKFEDTEEFQVLPPDSKLFSRLNRYFVFKRAETWEQKRKEKGEKVEMEEEEKTIEELIEEAKKRKTKKSPVKSPKIVEPNLEEIEVGIEGEVTKSTKKSPRKRVKFTEEPVSTQEIEDIFEEQAEQEEERAEEEGEEPILEEDVFNDLVEEEREEEREEREEEREERPTRKNLTRSLRATFGKEREEKMTTRDIEDLLANTNQIVEELNSKGLAFEEKEKRFIRAIGRQPIREERIALGLISKRRK